MPEAFDIQPLTTLGPDLIVRRLQVASILGAIPYIEDKQFPGVGGASSYRFPLYVGNRAERLEIFGRGRRKRKAACCHMARI